jgi:hypothetical protein
LTKSPYRCLEDGQYYVNGGDGAASLLGLNAALWRARSLLISGFTASGPRPIVAASNAGIAHSDVKVALLCPYMGRQHKMATIVPANDHPLLSLVTEDADRCRGEREEPASLRG